MRKHYLLVQYSQDSSVADHIYGFFVFCCTVNNADSEKVTMEIENSCHDYSVTATKTIFRWLYSLLFDSIKNSIKNILFYYNFSIKTKNYNDKIF